MLTLTKLSGPFYRITTKDYLFVDENGRHMKYVGYDEVFIEDVLFIWWKALGLEDDELCIALEEMSIHSASIARFGTAGGFTHTER